ncbi:prepilin-type N-terminal cleavage/methylation domain-containing protein [Faecalispora jeddahensis]|uniref:prepilin-type N-terminal cleavage/methylation domain-containing protein n=1 Tax=Faecalispora jeddahensis TaxID=1414721 RepID=UPI0027B953A4|nr:prepilin-type N-terminal cleavage/methylation domain-containing protein [Faecalispora jeddahensis]
MKNTLQTLQKKRKSKKGFTLMEMLIVVAIIAILIAIAIPTFSSQLDKAKLATDQANIRSAYAVMQASKLTGQSPEDGSNVTADATYYMITDGTFKSASTAPTNAYKLKSAISGSNKVETVPDFTASKGNYVIIKYVNSSETWSVESKSS